MGRTLYVCQKYGDEVGEGEQDRYGRHQNCGGTLDPVGEVDEMDDATSSEPPPDGRSAGQ